MRTASKHRKLEEDQASSRHPSTRMSCVSQQLVISKGRQNQKVKTIHRPHRLALRIVEQIPSSPARSISSDSRSPVEPSQLENELAVSPASTQPAPADQLPGATLPEQEETINIDDHCPDAPEIQAETGSLAAQILATDAPAPPVHPSSADQTHDQQPKNGM